MSDESKAASTMDDVMECDFIVQQTNDQEQPQCSTQPDVARVCKPIIAKHSHRQSHLNSYSKASPGELREMFATHGILIFLDVPESTQFGIDYMTWTIGPDFKGVKMIPPGVHFIHYTATNPRYSQVGIRTGFFHTFLRGEVLVKKWDKAAEDISDTPIVGEELERITGNLKELDRYLGPYPIEKHREWLALSSYITPSVICKLQPETGKICSAAPLRATGKIGDDKLPEMVPIPGTAIRFTSIPKLNHPVNATPQEVTKHNMDQSYKLALVLKESYADNEMDILGEVQFAFVCFLIGEVYEAFEAWKQLVWMLCNCDEALVTHPHMYHGLINVLHYEIREIPEDYFVDIVSGDNFLVLTLHNLFLATGGGGGPGGSAAAGVDRGLREKCRRFRQHLSQRFHWDFTEEPDEYAPTVVATD